jgi:hypothetical protein
MDINKEENKLDFHKKYIKEVYDIIKDYYGEGVTDIDESQENRVYIYIYFPSIEVSNEKFQKHIITDVYVRLRYILAPEGYEDMSTCYNLHLGIGRGSCTDIEYANRYIHSHVSTSNYFGFSETICTGSGPLRGILQDMSFAYREDFKFKDKESLYTSFCFEIKRFLETESLEGGPYNIFSRFRRIYEPSYEKFVFSDAMCDNFFKYIINKGVEFNFRFNKSEFELAYSYHDLCLIISKLAKEYGGFSHLNFVTVYDDGISFYGKSNSTSIPVIPENMPKLCTFKGRDIYGKINITYEGKYDEGEISLLSKPYIDSILSKIILVVNYGYKKDLSKKNIVF